MTRGNSEDCIEEMRFGASENRYDELEVTVRVCEIEL